MNKKADVLREHVRADVLSDQLTQFNNFLDAIRDAGGVPPHDCHYDRNDGCEFCKKSREIIDKAPELSGIELSGSASEQKKVENSSFDIQEKIKNEIPF